MSVHHTKKKKHKEKDKHEHHSSHKEKHQSKHHNHPKEKDASEKLSHKHKEHNSSSKKLSPVSYLNSENLSESTITSNKSKSWLNKSASNETDSSVISQFHMSHVQNLNLKSDNVDRLQNLCNINSFQKDSMTSDGIKSGENDKSVGSVKSELSMSATDRTLENGMKRKIDSDFENAEITVYKKVKVETLDVDIPFHIKKEIESKTVAVNVTGSEELTRVNSDDCDNSLRDITKKNSGSVTNSSISRNLTESICETVMLTEEVSLNENSSASNSLSILESPKILDNIKENETVESIPDTEVAPLDKIEKLDCNQEHLKQVSEQITLKTVKSEEKNQECSSSDKVDFEYSVPICADVQIVQNNAPKQPVKPETCTSSSDIKKEIESKHPKEETKSPSIKNNVSTSIKDKIRLEKHKSDVSKHIDKIKHKSTKSSDSVKSEKVELSENDKKSKQKDGKTHKHSSSSKLNQNKSEVTKAKDSKEKVKSHSTIKTELCLRCRQKLTSHRNVSIQCKRDRHDKLVEKLGVSQRIPRLPQGLDMRHLKYGKYIRLEVYPNGGAALLHLYWDEISHLHHKELKALAEEFLKVCFC